MKTLDRALRRASEALHRHRVRGWPHITYYSSTSWAVEADVPEYAPRGQLALTVLGMGNTLASATSSFVEALRKVQEQTVARQRRQQERARRGGGA